MKLESKIYLLSQVVAEKYKDVLIEDMAEAVPVKAVEAHGNWLAPFAVVMISSLHLVSPDKWEKEASEQIKNLFKEVRPHARNLWNRIMQYSVTHYDYGIGKLDPIIKALDNPYGDIEELKKQAMAI